MSVPSDSLPVQRRIASVSCVLCQNQIIKNRPKYSICYRCYDDLNSPCSDEDCLRDHITPPAPIAPPKLVRSNALTLHALPALPDDPVSSTSTN